MGRKKKSGINEAQKKVLRIIQNKLSANGYPPTVREIAEDCGVSSTATVYFHLKKLEEEHYIRRDPTKMRAIELLAFSEADPSQNQTNENSIKIPILGLIAAGKPILAEENIDDFLTVPSAWLAKGNCFVLNVTGNSMIKVGINDGDQIFIRQQEVAENGDIVAVLVKNDSSATVKRFYFSEGKIILKPENDEMQPMIFNPEEIKIIGKVIGLYRKL